MAGALRVAGAQIPVRDLASNLPVVLRAIETAAAADADILLTPEGSLSGYTDQFDADAVREGLDAVLSHARERELGLALGTCFVEDDGRCYNQIRFYGRDGSFKGFHAKVLLCDGSIFRGTGVAGLEAGTGVWTELGSATAPGAQESEKYASKDLEIFDFEGIAVAGLICNDIAATPFCTRNDPFLALRAAELGARIIFHAVNGGRTSGRGWDLIRRFQESKLQLTAATAGVPVVSVDNSAPLTLRCSSPSGVLGTDGTWLERLPWRGEHVFVTDVEV